mmetsp:Transcript_53262/g.88427  ORF Transcript_53262/g.88427 Transcript_53262/m.88427 type:complete len:123 (+) Transcript_53262:688-1056(+)
MMLMTMRAAALAATVMRVVASTCSEAEPMVMAMVMHPEAEGYWIELQAAPLDDWLLADAQWTLLMEQAKALRMVMLAEAMWVVAELAGVAAASAVASILVATIAMMVVVLAVAQEIRMVLAA